MELIVEEVLHLINDVQVAAAAKGEESEDEVSKFAYQQQLLIECIDLGKMLENTGCKFQVEQIRLLSSVKESIALCQSFFSTTYGASLNEFEKTQHRVVYHGLVFSFYALKGVFGSTGQPETGLFSFLSDLSSEQLHPTNSSQEEEEEQDDAIRLDASHVTFAGSGALHTWSSPQPSQEDSDNSFLAQKMKSADKGSGFTVAQSEEKNYLSFSDAEQPDGFEEQPLSSNIYSFW